MGSNPIPSIHSSVRISTNNRKRKNSKDVFKYIENSSIRTKSSNAFLPMQDLYNREEKLKQWMNKVQNELQEPDRSDVLKFVQFMQDKEKSILWIVRCITALLLLRKQLEKSFNKVTKEDIRKLFNWMNKKQYKASTHEKFRVIIKLFYKVVYGNNEYYPEAVKWFSVNVGKEKFRKEKRIDIEEYLEESEIQKLINAAQSIQKKAFLSCMYESGARPEEFLMLTNKDISIDTKGVIVILRGKTGERRSRIISYASLLQQWLDIHPLKEYNEFPLWISEATNYKNQQLGLRGAEKIIETTMLKAKIANKHTRLYILRHSRATHLATHLTEAQMWTFFGWTPGTKVVRHYIHLSGKDVDSALFALNEGNNYVKSNEYELKPKKCIRCSQVLSPGSNFCSKCALHVDLTSNYIQEQDLEKENNHLSDQVKILQKQLEELGTQVNSMIVVFKEMDQITKNQYAKKLFDNGVLLSK